MDMHVETTAKKVSTFRERFSFLVSSCGKSQSTVASEFGVAKQTISAWITGQTSPRPPVLSALSDYFGVSFAWLAGYDVPKRESKKDSADCSDMVQLFVNLFENADDRAKEDAIRILKDHQLRIEKD